MRYGVWTSTPRTFRLFSPDETSSNRLQAVFDATARAWMLPIIPSDEHLARAIRQPALPPNATHSRAAAQNTPHASPSYATSPDGIRIAYEAHGSGTPGVPALIFVHGWSCDRSYWNGQLDAFSPAYKVVAVDLAGHGESALGSSTTVVDSDGMVIPG